jgi:hypothetical protein
MHRSLILVVAGMTASTAAFADDEGSLRGSYAFTGASSCIQDSASFGFNPDFTPKGPTHSFSFTVEGIRTFHADGTGSVNARAVSVDEPPNASSSSTEFSFQFTYTIGPDRVLSTILVSGTYHATILPGPRAGQTLVNQVPARSGFIGEDARTIVLGQPGPVIESVAFSNGDQVLRLCNRSRILTRIKDDDR